MNERPLNAFILSLLGSLFVLLGTILGFVLSPGYPVFYNLSIIFTGVSGFLGTVMLLASVMLYLRPDLHVAWGVTILVLSVASFTSAFTGYAGFGLGIVGMVLGIIGGALAIGWTSAGATPAMPFRVCLACGRPSNYQFAFCPFCGAPAPVLSPPPGMGLPRQPPMPPQ